MAQGPGGAGTTGPGGEGGPGSSGTTVSEQVAPASARRLSGALAAAPAGILSREARSGSSALQGAEASGDAGRGVSVAGARTIAAVAPSTGTLQGTPGPDSEELEVGATDSGFITALANVLTHLASLAGRPQRVTRFHAIRAPQLSVHDYLTRVATYFHCSNECFVLALVYIDRILQLHPEFTICSLNIHRLLVTSVMLAAKFFDDVYYSNAYYAKVGGVRVQELNVLEALFLHLLGWRVHVLPQEYEQYRRHVLRAVNGGTADEEPVQMAQAAGQPEPEGRSS
mmetsp:Transcript_18472/g.41788  ORF Transcript_18472/g.41788 Transcript_18472/m.41788 type:complete len:284 (+) Transcript_18472:1-852(+)